MAGCDWRIERGAAARALQALERAGRGEARSGPSEAAPRKPAKRGPREDALGSKGYERVESQGCPHCAGPADLIRLLVRGQKIAKRTFESNCPPLDAIAPEDHGFLCDAPCTAGLFRS
jgi:hypothetical protein